MSPPGDDDGPARATSRSPFGGSSDSDASMQLDSDIDLDVKKDPDADADGEEIDEEEPQPVAKTNGHSSSSYMKNRAVSDIAKIRA